MPAFTFEIVRQGDAPIIAYVVKMSDERAVWCQVEALALAIKDSSGAFIRVKNPKGETVIRTGVATALASIEKCSYTICPLKKELKRRVSIRSRAAVEFGHFFPCEGQDGSCEVGGLSENF